MIYLDNNATTPCDPEIIDLMNNLLLDKSIANPSSNHAFGWKAHKIHKQAKEDIANIYNALPEDVVFTSGASEANNQAIIGTVQASILNNNPRKKIIISSIEHKCILNSAKFCEELYQYEVITIPVSNEGIIDLNALKDALNDNVLLVSIMAVNNEIGTIQPISEIGRLCRNVGAIFHVDAAQAGYENIDIIENNIDLLSLSGHKIYAPIGIGILIIDSMLKQKPLPLIHGGLQQENSRSGTIPTYLCAAISLAITKIAQNKKTEAQHLKKLRSLLLSQLDSNHIHYVINGSMEKRHPGNLNLSFPSFSNDLIVQKLQPHFAISTGSACNAGIIQDSHVLKALNLSNDLIKSAIRIGLGRFTTESEILQFSNALINILKNQ